MKYPLTWSGKGLRLVDLLFDDERRQVMNFLGSERQFNSLHVKADASEFIRNAYKLQAIDPDEYEDLVRRPAPVSTLHGLGYSIVNAADGRRVVQPNGLKTPLRGDIAPGSKSNDEIATDYLLGLQAQGIRAEFPQDYSPAKHVFVSRDFATYLRANGEYIKTLARDGDRDVAHVWAARSDQLVAKLLGNYRLATYGANDPDGGELAKVIEAKAPRQHAAWAAGLGDQWRMMDALRDILLSGAQDMTSGAYSTAEAGGALQKAMTAFQQGYQMLAEDAITKAPREATAEKLVEMGEHLRQVGEYLESAPIVETKVRVMVTDAVDMSADIASDILQIYARRELEQSWTSERRIGPEAGLS
ncbi:hypothetical protein [Paracidovorax wautersii]|uniref:Uncharacterized protein n=1 Tax=Paracidovorax wautersii TaxID=1177982 RepID=A0A1I2HXC1_9BURK|nr:hypothetical protein [Paracidovorax wautersii]SFF32981.1 hypothetical protein SAMN04489711_13210 [Paracidovorax wautersii]